MVDAKAMRSGPYAELSTRCLAASI